MLLMCSYEVGNIQTLARMQDLDLPSVLLRFELLTLNILCLKLLSCVPVTFVSVLLVYSPDLVLTPEASPWLSFYPFYFKNGTQK